MIMSATKASFTPKDVMTLREKTDMPMMECKAALIEADGDMAKAEEILRAKAKGKMDARSERSAGEGRIGIAVQGSDAVIVEVRAESDFTARNPAFLAMVEQVAKAALGQPAGQVKADAKITKLVDDVRLTTRENISFARGERFKGGSFGSYLHHDGKRGAIVQVEGATGIDQNVLNGIATHVVGYHPTPIGISGADVPAETVAQIREQAIAEAKETGKPEQIAQKMAEGRVAKYLKENTLLDQPYVKDPAGKQMVKELLPKGATIKKFVRYTVGG
jgi:elongation factor Ts